ncbi:MAG TPA: T9SS type A sorting domain-containing protein, partial [Flavisolibacter sp.]|nr:T9SS type A sorting domain-containing protein [Flavisolibacter sp.]
NNTNALISNGFVLPNMINDQGLNTGINFTVAQNFSGFNYFGATTGNNTGVYPDNVMKSFYYCNYADTAKIRITGLTLSHVYNFVFFGSRVDPKVGVTTAYRIGTQTVTLNATNNTQNTVQINGIVPDADGTVLITIYGTQQGGFGYLNALSIQGAQNLNYVPAFLTRRNTAWSREAVPETLPAAEAYPNPFTDDVSVKFDLKQNMSSFTIQVLDINGKIIHQRKVVSAPKGIWIQKLGLNGRSLNSGVYFIRVIGLPDQTPAIKILKQ